MMSCTGTGFLVSYSPHVLFGSGVHTCGWLIQESNLWVPQHTESKTQLDGRKRETGLRLHSEDVCLESEKHSTSKSDVFVIY